MGLTLDIDYVGSVFKFNFEEAFSTDIYDKKVALISIVAGFFVKL